MDANTGGAREDVAVGRAYRALPGVTEVAPRGCFRAHRAPRAFASFAVAAGRQAPTSARVRPLALVHCERREDARGAMDANTGGARGRGSRASVPSIAGSDGGGPRGCFRAHRAPRAFASFAVAAGRQAPTSARVRPLALVHCERREDARGAMDANTGGARGRGSRASVPSIAGSDGGGPRGCFRAHRAPRAFASFAVAAGRQAPTSARVRPLALVHCERREDARGAMDANPAGAREDLGVSVGVCHERQARRGRDATRAPNLTVGNALVNGERPGRVHSA
jgi:hypothetical protein